MTLEVLLFSAFMAGLFGSIHCVGMCGGITSALGLTIKNDNKILFSILFQFGRLMSYAIAGSLVGLLGASLVEQEQPGVIANTLRIAAALFMFLLGLYLAGWFPKFVVLERIGLPLWRKISPISQKLIPVTKFHQALLLGAIWGWIPCGLVYSVLIWSAASVNPASGAMTMVAFGLGTMPAMLAFTIGASQIVAVITQSFVRKIMGMLVMTLALLAIINLI